ncbi:MAG: SPW repeat protein [Rhodospirillales bacterium]|nr:SPW repeat protein [Rhodospirillales bacterium]MBO6787125.1 SPW repeat protein [Rhodospirillales bacterium]
MSLSVQQNWFTEHRGWEDVVSIVLGILVVAAPVVYAEHASQYANISSVVAGMAIVALGFLQFMWLKRWEEHLELACGIWVMASPYLMGYGGQLAMAHYALGFLVAALAAFELWQDRNRNFED